MPVHLKRATLSDAEALLRMQVAAFSPLLEKYRDFETSPAREDVEKMRRRVSEPWSRFYFILDGGKAVGGIRVVLPGNPTPRKRVSPLFILPEYQGRGFGRQVIAEAERLHGADNWSLGTILEEPRNCRFYEKLGYRRTGDSTPINERMTIIGYEKN